MDATLINTHTTLTKTGSFTVKNSGTASGTATASITSPDALALNLPLTVWPTSNVSTCTPTAVVGAGSVTQTMASLTMPAVTLAADASQAYCARITVTPANRPTLQSTAGDQSAKATLNATLAAGGWTAQATAAIATQKTDDIYPLDATLVPAATSSRWFTITNPTIPTNCVDVTSSGGAGAAVITYQCSINANQRWKFVLVDGSNSLVTIAPKHTPNVRLTATASGTAVIQEPTSNVNPRWYLQKVTDTTWQIVSAETGKCQPAGTAWGAANSSQLIDCNQATAKVTLTSEKLSLSTSGLIFPQITFDFTSNQSGTAFAVQQDGPVGWTTVATVSNSTRASFSRDLIASGATSTFRVVFLDVAGNVRDVLYEGIQVRRPTNNTVTGVAGFE